MPASDSAASTLADLGQRTSRLSLTMAWWSVCSAMFYIFVAASLAINFGSRNAIAGMLIAVVVYAVVNYPLVRYAARTGASTSLVSRLVFGARGGVIATILLGLTAVYYAVFEGSVLAVAATKVFGSLSYPMASFLLVAYSAPLVIGSVQTFLSRLNGALLPLYLVGLSLLVILAASRYGVTSRWLELGGHPLSWFGVWQCVASYLGIWVLMMVTIDFARLARPEDERYHALFNFGAPFYLVAFVLNGLAGMFLVGTVQLASVTELSVVDATILVLGGAGALAFIWATQTRINCTNLHVAVTNLQAVVETTSTMRLPKWVYVILIAVTVFGLMCATNVFSTLLVALQYQSVFITAWVGVVLPFVLKDSRTPSQIGAALSGARGIEAGNVGAWVAGTACGLLVMHLPGGYATLAGLSSFLVAGAVQLVSSGKRVAGPITAR